MAEVTTVAEKVRQHWLSQGLQVSPITLTDISELRRSQPCPMPVEYESFLRVAGLPDDEDGEGFRFWSPSEVRATRDVLGEAGYASHAIERSVIIADYLQESWWYALWLTGPFVGHVSLAVGEGSGKDPPPPLWSFVDFLIAYLNEDASLYPPLSGSEIDPDRG